MAATPDNVARAMEQAKPSEAAVLGLILQNGKRIVDVKPYLKPADFILVRNAELYGMMLSLEGEGKQPDLIAVDTASRLKHNGGADDYALYLTSLLDYAVGDVEQHARKVRDLAYRRRLAGLAPQLEHLALNGEDDDAPKLAAKAGLMLSEIAVSMTGNHEPMTLADAVMEHWDEIESTTGKEGVSGLATGYADYDRITDGWQPETVNVIAARPGMGKTALLLCIALNVARRIMRDGTGGGVYLWLGEQTRREATMRLISIASGINSVALRRGLRKDGMTPHQYSEYVRYASMICKLPIFLDDKKSMTVPEMVMRATKVARRTPLELIGVDYIGLVTPHMRTNSSENEQITVMSRCVKTDLAAIAPVALLSQLNRELERRQDKRPQLSDLRASGSLEQDADTVTFIYRDVIYNEDTEHPNKADFIVAKNRHGGTGTASTIFENVYTRFLTAQTIVHDLGHRS